ncbi:MAG: hypothetical protein HXY23_03230 [Parvularculaceae bacterium]|nr:hypothetical protein [Parvularculaceae bacterium]
MLLKLVPDIRSLVVVQVATANREPAFNRLIRHAVGVLVNAMPHVDNDGYSAGRRRKWRNGRNADIPGRRRHWIKGRIGRNVNASPRALANPAAAASATANDKYPEIKTPVGSLAGDAYTVAGHTFTWIALG